MEPGLKAIPDLRVVLLTITSFFQIVDWQPLMKHKINLVSHDQNSVKERENIREHQTQSDSCSIKLISDV